MVYKWRFYNYKVDANIVGQEVEKLEKKHGEVTAQLLLDNARSKKSKLHDLFEWDDTVAAEKYRLTQATQIITALAVVYEDITEEPKTVRAFANIGAKNKGSFITMATALSDEQSRAIVLKHALEELQAFRSKYADLTELAEIFAGIDKLSIAG